MIPAADLMPMSTTPGANLPPISTTPAVNFVTGTAGVVDASGKYLYVNFTTSRCPNKIIKTFLLKIFPP